MYQYHPVEKRFSSSRHQKARKKQQEFLKGKEKRYQNPFQTRATGQISARTSNEVVEKRKMKGLKLFVQFLI